MTGALTSTTPTAEAKVLRPADDELLVLAEFQLSGTGRCLLDNPAGERHHPAAARAGEVAGTAPLADRRRP
jgi:hypothetical protein